MLDQALEMLQRSLDVTLVRMCQSFEDERRLAHEELTKRQKELIFLATHDALTGLPNRTLILDRIDQILTRTRLTQEPVAALFLDLDNFKSINDTLGHGVGDELLCAVAARLEGVIRETDALGRLGGDEFVVIADGLSLAAGPELIAERLLEAFKDPFKLNGAKDTSVFVKASIGIAAGGRDSAEELLRDADIAMYRAKWGGKSRYLVFETGMQAEVQTRMEVEMDLQSALEDGEFFLVYQPTFDLESMSPRGVEALVRWRRPGRGVVEPDDFVPLLEQSGMIVEVGAWILEEACAQGAKWREAGHSLDLAVNVSAIQLDTDELVAHVEDALDSSGLDPTSLTLEITETTLMRNAEETALRLAALKRLGVRIAVDDFGTGYSSMAHLQRFPVDLLKIDRSFISQLQGGGEAEILLHSLVQLGKALSIETTAEGIERPDDLSLIKSQECDNGQGFLFARPLSAADADAFFSQWHKNRPFEVRQGPAVKAGLLRGWLFRYVANPKHRCVSHKFSGPKSCSQVAHLLAESRVPPLGPGELHPAARPRPQRVRPAQRPRHGGERPKSGESLRFTGLWLYHDGLDESHAISQELDTAEGSFWHAIMHRREPDASSWKYWLATHRRASRARVAQATVPGTGLH